jgi:hypothetical protein
MTLIARLGERCIKLYASGQVASLVQLGMFLWCSGMSAGDSPVDGSQALGRLCIF